MTVDEAREIGRAWVAEEGSRQPGFLGAHFSGSIASGSGEAGFPAFTDIDIYWLSPSDAPRLQEKFRYRGALLETVSQSAEEYRSPETILADPFKAHLLLDDSIIADPNGILTPLAAAVRSEYAAAKWLRARCDALKTGLRKLDGELAGANAPGEGFGTLLRCIGQQAALVAVARLRAPTVRRSLALAKSVLRETGDSTRGFFEVLGCADWSRARVEAGLAECVEAYDRAVEVRCSPCPAAFNLSRAARPYLTDGAREMIDAGDHREAMYWIARMRWTAEGALRNDLPAAERSEWAERRDRFLASLGLRDAGDYRHRAERAGRLTEETIGWADRQMPG